MDIKKIDKKFRDEFKDRCKRAKADEFLRFITEPDKFNISIIELIAGVENVLKFKTTAQPQKACISEENMKIIINEFFEKYLPQKADEIKSILDKKHPYFVDGKGKSTVNISNVGKDDERSSAVGHRGNQNFLTFDVFLHNDKNDLVVIAHELAHAVSGHHKEIVRLIREGTTEAELDALTKDLPLDKDCVGEIESHIVEGIIVRFLTSKGMFTKDDIKNYNNHNINSLIREISLIREESDIIKALPDNYSEKDLQELAIKFESQGRGRIADRIEKMHDEPQMNSFRMFRYVVGRIVSDCWLKKFDKADASGKEQMLDNFQSYLDKTHKLDLDGACETLLDNNFNCAVEDYVTNRLAENKAEKAKSL